jgi:nickel-type superoxide dismutase maturation protease
MAPTLQAGQDVLAAPISQNCKNVALGEIVVARHPYVTHELIIKRVASVTENGDYILEGDNPSESTDSRSFGALPPQKVLGQVICRFD